MMHFCTALLAPLLMMQTLDWREFHVEVRPEGGLGRLYVDRDFHREVEVLESGLVGGAVWKCRVFLFRELDVRVHGRAVRRRFTDAEIAQLSAVAEDFARCVRAYSGGRLRFALETQVIDAPLRKISGDEKPGYSAWTDVTEEHIGKYVGDDVDSVLVFFPSAGLPVPFWGGTTGGGSFRRAGYSCICVLDTIDHDTYTEVALHEWLHQADWARSEQSGYVGLPDLHAAGALGYKDNVLRRGWMDWYRDFMGVYFAPRTWERLSMLQRTDDGPRPKFEGGFVHAWRLSAPFDNPDDKGYDPAQIDETDPPVAAWRAVESGDQIDLFATMEKKENAVVYAHVFVHAPAGPARLWIGSDDGVKAWVNTVLVHDHHIHRGVRLDQDAVDVEFAEGWNRVLVKVDQGGGGWGLALRVSQRDGSPLPGLEFRADPPAQVVPAATFRPHEPEREFVWADARVDPFKQLPLLDPRDVGVTGGENYLQLGDGPGERLDFAKRGLARKGRLWLIRCDLMDLVADLDAQVVNGVAREGEIEKHLLGWVSIAGRPAFIARWDPGFTPKNDVELLGEKVAGKFRHPRKDPRGAK